MLVGGNHFPLRTILHELVKLCFITHTPLDRQMAPCNPGGQTTNPYGQLNKPSEQIMNLTGRINIAKIV